jgi:hypothetical protein
MRKWSLTVGDIGGQNAYDLSQLGFEFDVQMQTSPTVWKAHVRIWNPPPDLPGKVGKEYTHVNLDAGYMPPSKQYGNVIQGMINYYHWGRQNATDVFLDLHMAMHDTAFTAAVVNTWIPIGATKNDIVNQVVTMAMAPYGIVIGQITDLGPEKSTRGRALAGMARDILRDMARTADAQWFIDNDGKLHMLKQSEILSLGNVSVPLLSPSTGLIDVPTQVMGSGVEIQCLLNPSIRPGTRVQVDDKYVNRVGAIDGSEAFKTTFQAQSPLTAKLAPGGYYSVGQVKHWGANRGTPWYSRIITQSFTSVQPQAPLTSVT